MRWRFLPAIRVTLRNLSTSDQLSFCQIVKLSRFIDLAEGSLLPLLRHCLGAFSPALQQRLILPPQLINEHKIVNRSRDIYIYSSLWRDAHMF